MPVTSLLPDRFPSTYVAGPNATLLPHLKSGRLAIFLDPATDQALMFCAARNVSASAINDMATHARGLVSLVLSAEAIDRLGIPMQPVRHRNIGWGQAVSIEARDGITTGISAAERAHTIRTATAPNAGPDDIVSPGHIFPIAIGADDDTARSSNNVLSHLGSVLQLVRIAGGGGAVISQILGAGGEVATVEEAMALAARTNLPTIDEIGMRKCTKLHCVTPARDI
ncbi:3,4-dihydroxy-2-butanone-4-phosphate synthase [Phaeobacter sp. J2-8]|uniref:3,4-dihydroxy-2-butanone-4-phosphate synthase n=1 Tax=Phaeobacter sp. J2-8 TaxID=2931394 RepID=UPI001FD2D911|nr:3,4-dihydroxy-2-butanone-4-phosphate synthase [Phaeobacter sp. J2-8]MCJ7873533.1 3,4-dihydroxy-2-butanone-4-phosphate synthase [Phaeobacter sp. J2-8]